MRLNKYVSDSGYCSRREADKLIELGSVMVNGKCAELGMQIMTGDKVVINGRHIKPKMHGIYIAFNKPIGIECTTNPKVKDNIIDYINYPERIYPVGRLDKRSSGLILLTNDGELSNEILKARHFHEKEYIVEVNKPISEDFLDKMRLGVEILDTVTRPCEVYKISKTSFKIILTQGLNRQIRRMCEVLDYRVESLKRVRILNIMLDDLAVGQYRILTDKELVTLKQLIGQD